MSGFDRLPSEIAAEQGECSCESAYSAATNEISRLAARGWQQPWRAMQLCQQETPRSPEAGNLCPRLAHGLAGAACIMFGRDSATRQKSCEVGVRSVSHISAGICCYCCIYLVLILIRNRYS
jgi:hypothetical protein